MKKQRPHRFVEIEKWKRMRQVADRFGRGSDSRIALFRFPFSASACYSESPEIAPASKYLSPNQELRIGLFIGQLSEDFAWLRLPGLRRSKILSRGSGWSRGRGR